MYAKMTNEATRKYISYKIDGRIVNDYDLYIANEYDKKLFTPKEGCALYRLLSLRTGAQPIVSINEKKNIIYFLEDENEEKSIWQKKGHKLIYKIFK